MAHFSHVFACLSALALTARLAYATSAGVWQYWDYPSGLHFSVDQYVKVMKSGPTRFFSHQLFQNGTDAIYIGLQQTPDGPLAIFSVWNSVNATTGSPGSYCVAFGGEGVGRSCRIRYYWKVGVKYRLRVWRTNQVGDQYEFRGSVQDTRTGKETVLGSIYNAPGQGLIASSVSWIEDYQLTCRGRTAARRRARRPCSTRPR